MSNGTVIIKGGSSLIIESGVEFDYRQAGKGKHEYHHPDRGKRIRSVEIKGNGIETGALSFIPVEGRCVITISYEDPGWEVTGEGEAGKKKAGRGKTGGEKAGRESTGRKKASRK